MNQEIRDYLLSQRPSEEITEFTDGDSLLESGVLDSMAMVGLIAHLEETYEIAVDEDDMTPENFDSVDAIVSYVRQKQAEGERFQNSPVSTE